MGFCPEFQPGDPARVGIVGLNLLKWGILFKILLFDSTLVAILSYEGTG